LLPCCRRRRASCPAAVGRQDALNDGLLLLAGRVEPQRLADGLEVLAGEEAQDVAERGALGLEDGLDVGGL